MLSSDNLVNSVIQYNSTNPQNLKPEGYSDYDILDFRIVGPGRCLVGNSVRLLFDVEVLNNNVVGTKCAYDGPSGGHTFVESVTTSSASQGMLEQIRFYGRQVACRARALNAKEDYFNSQFVSEARCPDEIISDKLLKGYIPVAFQGQPYNAEATTALDVCLALDFCLNSFVGPNLLPLDSTGDLTVSISLPRSTSVLFGNAAIGGAQTYKITNPKLLYQTVQDIGKNEKSYVMKVRSDFKQSINSSFVNISSKVPLLADAVYMNFIRADMENNNQFNSMMCQVLPNVSRLEFAFNDSLSQNITYQLINPVDYLSNFNKAIRGVLAGDNDTTLVQNSGNDGFGLGLSFGTYVPLQDNKLSIGIQSDVQSGLPFTVYVHVTGILSI